MDPTKLGLTEENAAHFRETYGQSGEARQDMVKLAEYVPDVLNGYLSLRRAVFSEDSHLSPAVRELIVLAIECTAMRSNPPPLLHARKAVEAGATPAEVAEVLSLCIQLAGMMTFMECGRFVLRAAEEAANDVSGRPAPEAQP